MKDAKKALAFFSDSNS